MKTLEIIGYKRANLGKKASKDLRRDSNVPCVLYGGKEQVHFQSPMILFRELVYTHEAHMVELNIEGEKYDCILQDLQFHPVSEMILHADFYQIERGKVIKMDIPVQLEGRAKGAEKGGVTVLKRRKLTVRALAENMPEHLTVDISELDLGKTIKVGDVPSDGFEITTSPRVSVVSIEIPRALKTAAQEEEEAAEAAAAEGGEEGAAEAPAAEGAES